MYKIITYLSNGKSIEKFNSFADAYDEWRRFDPWHGGCKKELYRNEKLQLVEYHNHSRG